MQTHFPVHATFVRDPTDVVGRRIAAFVIDFAVAVGMFLVLAASLGERTQYTSSTQAENVCERINNVANEVCVPLEDTVYVFDDGDLAALFLLPLAYLFLNDALLTGITGFSIGKGLVGLRVIKQSDGQLCGIGRSMLRWLLWLADAAPYCIPLVGLITGLTTKGHRRVGDIAASTLVVDKKDVGVVPVVPGLNTVSPPPWGPTTWGAPVPTWTSPSDSTQPWDQPAAPPAQPAPQPAPPTWGQPPPAWGQQPAPTAWGQPAPPQPTPPPPVVVPASTPGVDAPLWDDARDAYIQWDPDLSAWVQWNDATKQWQPIS